MRYVQLARPRIEAKTNTRFGVGVSADRRVGWKLAGKQGTAAPGLLVLHAPAKPGRYALVVSAGGHASRATVIVSRR